MSTFRRCRAGSLLTCTDSRRLRDNPQYEFVSDRAIGATSTYGVTSISLLARRTGA